MARILEFPRHARASDGSTTEGAGDGLGIPEGHSASGQLSENHCIVRSSRRTWMSFPFSSSTSRLESSSARELTADRLIRSISPYARATVSNCSIPFMPAVSVISPRSSRANLPRARVFTVGYPTDMELKSISKRINERLGVLGISAAEASRRSGHPDVIKNVRKTAKDGHGSAPKIQTLIHLAGALECDPTWLLGPENTPAAMPDSDQRSNTDILAEQRDWHLREAEALERAISILRTKDRAS